MPRKVAIVERDTLVATKQFCNEGKTNCWHLSKPIYRIKEKKTWRCTKFDWVALKGDKRKKRCKACLQADDFYHKLKAAGF